MSGPETTASAASVWLTYNDAGNRHDLETVEALVATDLSVSLNGQPGVASAAQDREAMAELMASYPDFRRVVEEVIPAGSRATIRWRMLGTPAGADVPPLDVAGCSVVEVDEGVLVAAYLYYDGAALDDAIRRSHGASS